MCFFLHFFCESCSGGRWLLCQGALWQRRVACPALCHRVAVALGAVTLGLQGVQTSQAAAGPRGFEAELQERRGAPGAGTAGGNTELEHLCNEEWPSLFSLEETGLRGDLTSVYEYQEDGVRGWTNASEQKMVHGKCHLYLVTMHGNRLTMEAVESPSLELFKNYLSAILCHVL